MGLMQLNAEGMTKIDTAIAVIKEFEPPEGYYVADSGGADSGIIVDLVMNQAKSKADYHYNVSPIDPPEVYLFLKEKRPLTKWEYFARGFWKINEGLPTRKFRWCCRLIKEAGGMGRTIVTGIRWAESTNRKSRCLLEPHRTEENTSFLHPIICWTNEERDEYYKITGIPKISLYEQGFTRIGCVGCPQAPKKTRLMQLERYPKIAHNWRAYADRYFDNHPNTKSLKALGSKDAYWNWWLSGLSVKKYLNLEQRKLLDEGK
jgi:phosphoadenosine phosphosulfate reductase